jgi:hypothetical protein
MPVISDWDLIIDVDQVLRGQGADPTSIRERSTNLVEIAERAISEGFPLLEPELLYRRFSVESVIHERLLLEGGGELKGALLAQHMAPATEVIVILCTIGIGVETLVKDSMATDIVFALALDGLGSAGVEALANAACRYFEIEAEAAGLATSIPLSPGMVDWTVEDGQPQIFNLLPVEDIGITLTPSYIMLPRKSLSMVIGLGKAMTAVGTQCDFCSMRETCRYQDHYT